MLKKLFISLLNTLCQWQIVVGTGAAVLSAETIFLKGQNVLDYIPLISFNFFGTLAVYQLAKSRMVEWAIQKVLRQKRNTHLRILELLLSILCSAMAFYFLIQLPQSVIYLILCFSPLILFYLIPISPPISLRNGLRAIPFAKNFLVGILWAFITVHLVESCIAQNTFHVPDLHLYAQRFFFICALTIPFDIRDRTYVAQNQMNTLPVWMGIDGSKIFALICLALSFVFAFSSAFYSNLHLIALVIALLLALISVYMSSYKRNPYFYDLFSEGIMSAPFLMYLIMTRFYEI